MQNLHIFRPPGAQSALLGFIQRGKGVCSYKNLLKNAGCEVVNQRPIIYFLDHEKAYASKVQLATTPEQLSNFFCSLIFPFRSHFFRVTITVSYYIS